MLENSLIFFSSSINNNLSKNRINTQHKASLTYSMPSGNKYIRCKHTTYHLPNKFAPLSIHPPSRPSIHNIECRQSSSCAHRRRETFFKNSRASPLTGSRISSTRGVVLNFSRGERCRFLDAVYKIRVVFCDKRRENGNFRTVAGKQTI